MKTTLKFILFVIPVFFFSCQKDEITPSVASSITSSGTLSGIISGYVPNTVDSVKAEVESLIGTSKVTSTGGFSIGLSIPELTMMHSLSGVAVSDTTAMTGTLSVGCFKNGILYSDLSKSSCSVDSLIIPGMSESLFVYSDRDFTVKGSHTDIYTQGDFSITGIRTYQVTFKKGWNELVSKTNSYSITTNNITEAVTLSNAITSDLKWRYSNIGNYYVPGEKSVTQQVKSFKSFPLFLRK